MNITYIILEFMKMKRNSAVSPKQIKEYIVTTTGKKVQNYGLIGSALNRLQAKDYIKKLGYGKYRITPKGQEYYNKQSKTEEKMENNLILLNRHLNRFSKKNLEKLLDLMERRADLYETDSISADYQYGRVIKDMRELL